MSQTSLAARILEFYRHSQRFIQFQYTRRRLTRIEAALPPAVPPMPPPLLRYRVQGNFDRDLFDEIGHLATRDIENGLAAIGSRPADFSDVLDFACGCGRTIRHIGPRNPYWTLYGSDVDAAAIAWNRQHLGDLAVWAVNPAHPPTVYVDGQFDLILCISLFTHLSEEHQFAWLAELRRVLKPDGVALISVRGPFHSSRLSRAEQKRVETEGVLFKERPKRWVRLDGHPDYYQTTYHSPAYVHRRWTEYLELVRYIPKGLGNSQDLVVMRASP